MKPRPGQRFLVLHDSGDGYASAMFANAARALKDARLDFVSFDLATGSAMPDPRQFGALLTCVERLHLLSAEQLGQISSAVEAGGGLAVLYRAWNPGLARLLGVEDQGSWPRCLPASEDAEGLCFPGDHFPGFRGLEVDGEEIRGHTSYDLWPRADAEIVASAHHGRPLAWVTRPGAGRALYWNTAILAQKRCRGLIVQSVMAVVPIGVLPIANAATIQIDDFPAPHTGGHVAALGSEFSDLTVPEFLRRIWHPDMLALAKAQGLIYTYLITFNYNARNTPPFLFDEWNRLRLDVAGQSLGADVYAASLARRDGELGVHGYNHLPLTAEFWPSPAAMKGSLQAVAERWRRDGLGPPPTTFVPPANVYDRDGARALTAGIPSLRIISGSYLSGDAALGGLREFGPEPWNPRLYAIPRATSGFVPSPGKDFNLLSQIAALGVWTHFLHADDAFDTPRAGVHEELLRNPLGRPWRGDPNAPAATLGLYHHFVRWVERVRRGHPWLRFLATRDARPVIESHLQSEWTVAVADDAVSIEAPRSAFFQLRLNGKRRLDSPRILDAELVHSQRHRGFELHTLRAVGSKIALPLREGEGGGPS